LQTKRRIKNQDTKPGTTQEEEEPCNYGLGNLATLNLRTFQCHQINDLHQERLELTGLVRSIPRTRFDPTHECCRQPHFACPYRVARNPSEWRLLQVGPDSKNPQPKNQESPERLDREDESHSLLVGGAGGARPATSSEATAEALRLPGQEGRAARSGKRGRPKKVESWRSAVHSSMLEATRTAHRNSPAPPTRRRITGSEAFCLAIEASDS
jgi:hypothetical protein